MRILLVTQMGRAGRPDRQLPGAGDPASRLSDEVVVASISRRGGLPTEYASLVRRAREAAKRTRPDVVFAHFLFPAGAAERSRRGPPVRPWS